MSIERVVTKNSKPLSVATRWVALATFENDHLRHLLRGRWHLRPRAAIAWGERLQTFHEQRADGLLSTLWAAVRGHRWGSERTRIGISISTVTRTFRRSADTCQPDALLWSRRTK